MRNLFGCGLHPLADVRAQQFEGSDPTLNAIEKTMQLGTPFRVVDEATRFQVEVAKATLETRDAKHEPRSLAEQRTTWLNDRRRCGRGPFRRGCRRR